jgi:hypothetical protein
MRSKQELIPRSLAALKLALSLDGVDFRALH